MPNIIGPKLMLMSLGGSPEPLIHSIQSFKPLRIVFLASHDSVSLSGEILKTSGLKPAVEYEITEDPNLMYECYKAARQCVHRIKNYNVQGKDVLVDYTGGTKVMTAALILATAGFKFRFNYVGGDQRDKNGVGIVKAGHEKLFAEMSPWAIFAEEERRQVVTLFNRRRFSSVIEIIDDNVREFPHQIESYFKFVRFLAHGFLCWDQFEHKAALRNLDKGVAEIDAYLSIYTDAGLQEFKRLVQECRFKVDSIIEKTEGLKKCHNVLIDDLINNARRKIADRLFDDAAARIYRTLELYGQIIFREIAKCTNDKVKPEIIPEDIKERFMRKYYNPHKKILELPLTATFEYLRARGHEAGSRFFERIKEIKNIQSNRNSSILAHGIKPVKEKAVSSIFNTVSDFVQATNFFDFPKLP